MPPKKRVRRSLKPLGVCSWHIGAAARPNLQDLTAALLLYIDGAEKDELIFDLGKTYRCAREGTALDPYNMADLSDLLVAILKVVPGGRIRKTDMRYSLLEAIEQRSEKLNKVTTRHREVAERVAKQVLRACVMYFLFSMSLHTCIPGMWQNDRYVDANGSTNTCDQKLNQRSYLFLDPQVIPILAHVRGKLRKAMDPFHPHYPSMHTVPDDVLAKLRTIMAHYKPDKQLSIETGPPRSLPTPLHPCGSIRIRPSRSQSFEVAELQAPASTPRSTQMSTPINAPRPTKKYQPCSTEELSTPARNSGFASHRLLQRLHPRRLLQARARRPMTIPCGHARLPMP